MIKERELLARVLTSELWSVQEELQVEIRELLAEPEKPEPAPEPVAWKDRSYGNLHHTNYGNSIPLYTAPPKPEPPMTGREMYQRGYAAAKRELKREPLSDEEINAIDLPEKQCTIRELVRIIEKAHGIGIVE